jgi:hypothetical protein
MVSLSSPWPKGQEHLLEKLGPLVLASKLAPVVLIYGKRGIGKSKFLGRLASLLFCESRSACGVCGSCNMVVSGIHPDVLIVDPLEKQLKVENAKEISEHLSYTSSRARVVLVEDVDRMNEQGVNRLLKVLEEPPEDAFVMMSTSRLDALLPTLRSRALKLLMKAPSEKDIECWVKENKIDLKGLNLQDLCKRAGHSPCVILEILDRVEDNKFSNLLHEKNSQVIVSKGEKLMKEFGYTAKDVVTEMEYALNLYYREMKCGDMSLQGIYDRRNSLKRLRLFAIQKKISLNALSALESVLLTESV